ncbi:MAG: hypothetical protein QF712_04140 [Candidatus Marinimicrobia bacterium]|nr:hypothetical protein [Candidatus Neomarinimicrobiota bacterium]|tara:strand:- start:304 stop:507 length:204 start_codon:yes stop_codon:yes gene_type:complete
MDSELRKNAVKDFLQCCLDYAYETIAKKTESGDDSEGLEKWIAYRDYTQIALDEVEKGDLDHWFTNE